MEIGSSYRVRRAPTRPLSLLTAAAGLEMELVRGGFSSLLENPWNLLKPTWKSLFITGKRYKLKPVEEMHRPWRVLTQSLCCPQDALTILALMCIGYCQSQKLTEVLVCRFFVVAAVCKHQHTFDCSNDCSRWLLTRDLKSPILGYMVCLF